MMGHSNWVQSNFLSGEWSPYVQGRLELPNYKNGMNVCRNGFPIEEGAWLRRSGTRFAATTLNGQQARLMRFDFEQNAPYQIEFTNYAMRFFASSTLTSGLSTPLPQDMRLVGTNDNQQVLSISTANPAVVNTGSSNTWSTNDQIMFEFASTVAPSFCPLLRNRQFKITVIDSTHFSLSDPITNATIDGSTLGWSTPAANTVIAVHINQMTSPYAVADLPLLRAVQAETESIILHGKYQPEVLAVVNLPTASSFATFSMSQIAFKDGPYLDPPTDGTILQPTVTSNYGLLPTSASWASMAWNGTVFCTVANGTAIAATSPDGKTWTQRALPATANWTAIAWNGSVFCAIATGTVSSGAIINGNVAATSPDGITWTAQTSIQGLWSSIAWNGTVFCAVESATLTGGGGVLFGGNLSMTSPTGVTWTQHSLPTQLNWSSIAWNGSQFCAIAAGLDSIVTTTNVCITAPDGAAWTQQTLPASSTWTAITTNGSTEFVAISANNNIVATSVNGSTWIERTLPSSSFWSSIAWNGSSFMVGSTGNSDVYATSPDAITWTQYSTPLNINIGALASNGTIFCAVSYGSNISFVSTSGLFGGTQLQASSILSINSGQGFLNTDIGRSIRLLSEPLLYNVGSTYNIGNSVKWNNSYYTCIQSTNVGHQPDISPAWWTINTSAYTWTWGNITSIVNTSTINVTIQGAQLLYSGIQINTWQLGVYSQTTGWPTCGVYYEGRLWLAGALPNRIDASKVNDLFNMAPTSADGTVADNNGISYIFNDTQVNPIYWMIGTGTGIVCGTQGGEWVIQASALSNPITPTSIQAHRNTNYGCAQIEPQHTELTISFVQRYQRKLLEYFPDVFSGKFTAPNLTQNSQHLTIPNIEEIRYQNELAPIIWARCGDGSLIGAAYKRISLFSTQGPEFIGWHRHDLGSGRTVTSISVGPSVDGNLDTLGMITLDSTTGIYHVEFMEDMFQVDEAITAGWWLDDAVVPDGGVITGTMQSGATITFSGMWHLNGKTATVWCGGIDCGDAVVSNGQITVPIDVNLNSLFLSTYLQSISSQTAYGAMTCPVSNGTTTYYVPAVVGFTYTSQGQTLRPDTLEQVRSPQGPGAAKPRRIFQFGAMMSGTQGVSFGTNFSKLHAANFQSPGNNPYTALQLFNGVYWDTLDDWYSFDSMLCWQVTRPYPCAIMYVSAFMETMDR